jgi:hypothetical protein
MEAIPACKEIPGLRRDKQGKKIFRTFGRQIRKTSGRNCSGCWFF